jgi:hypothetical protein
MLYDSTKVLIRGMLRDMEATDTIHWDDQVEFGRECLYEMHQMTRPQYKGWKADAKVHSDSTSEFVKATRAIPFVRSMVSAIRRRDHAMAVVNGRAALAEM